MATTELVEFSTCNPLQILDRTGKPHSVCFEFGKIDKEGIGGIHGGHKSNLFENNSVNFLENNVIRLQVPIVPGG